MRMLFVCFVVILFISGKSANPVEHVDNVEASGEIDNANNDEDAKPIDKSVTEQLNSEIEMPKEVVKEHKRPKKSYYPSAPCAPCGGYSDQYAQPNVAYSQPISYGPPNAYGPPSYGGYSAPPPVYGQQQYRPRYGGRKGNYIRPAQAYQPQPSYQAPQPTYQPQQISYQPSYQAPQQSYQPQPSYQQPQQSYQPQPSYQPSPSYKQRPAPSYSRPSYSSPSYGNQVSSAPVYPGPAQSYAYSSPSPTVPCSSNLLFGCQPHVSEVPCSAYSPSYGSPAYGPPQQYSPSPAYRSNTDEDSSPAQGPPMHSSDMTPNNADNSQSNKKTTKENSVSSILSAPVDGGVDKTGTNEKNENNGNTQKDTNISATNQQAQSEDEKRRSDTLKQLEEMRKKSEENSKQQQQNNLPSSQTHQNDSPHINKQQSNDKQNKGTTVPSAPSAFAHPFTFGGHQPMIPGLQQPSMNVGAPNNNLQQLQLPWQ